MSKEAEGSNREDDVVFTGEAALDGCSQRVIATDVAAHFLHLAAADANICSDEHSYTNQQALIFNIHLIVKCKCYLNMIYLIYFNYISRKYTNFHKTNVGITYS